MEKTSLKRSVFSETDQKRLYLFDKIKNNVTYSLFFILNESCPLFGLPNELLYILV